MVVNHSLEIKAAQPRVNSDWRDSCAKIALSLAFTFVRLLVLLPLPRQQLTPPLAQVLITKINHPLTDDGAAK